VVLVFLHCLGGWGRAFAADDVPPVIVLDPVEETVAAGGETPVVATVTDDSGVADVRLNLRYPGEGGFTAFRMQPEGPDRFGGPLSAQGVAPGTTIDYFVTATDAAGNVESRGFDFDPFSVRVIEPAPVVTAPTVSSSRSGTRTALYVVGAALAVGLAVALSYPGPDRIDVCCEITLGGQ